MLGPLYTSELAIAPSSYPNQYTVFSIHTASAPDPVLCTSCLDYGKSFLMTLQLLGSRLSAYIHTPPCSTAQICHTPAKHRPILRTPHSSTPIQAFQEVALTLFSSLIYTGFLHTSTGFLKLLILDLQGARNRDPLKLP